MGVLSDIAPHLCLALALLTLPLLAGCAGEASPFPLPTSQQRMVPVASGGWIVTPRPDTPADAPLTRIAGPGGWLPDWGVKCSSTQACHSDVTVNRATSQGDTELDAEEDIPDRTLLPFRVRVIVSTRGSSPSFEIPAKTNLVEEAGVVRAPRGTSLAIRFPSSTWRLQPVRGASVLALLPDTSLSFLHVILRGSGEAELVATQPGQSPAEDWDLIIDAVG